MKKAIIAGIIGVASLISGCGAGGDGDHSESGVDWDGFLVAGNTQWRCRDIQNGQFVPNHACGHLKITDQRWPTPGVKLPSIQWLPGVEISTVCSKEMYDYKLTLATIPKYPTGIVVENHFDLREALWIAAPNVAIKKPITIWYDMRKDSPTYRQEIKREYYHWDNERYEKGTSGHAKFHYGYWREINAGPYAILWKINDYHWIIWTIKDGQCRPFRMDNGNYAETILTVHPTEIYYDIRY
jgi:hypothetical protein